MFERLKQLVFPAVGAIFVIAGCSTPPTDLDLSLDKPTANGTYRVALVPPPQAVAINKIHSWQMKLTTPDGQPVEHAAVAVDGGMPQHGHGLPTQPRVTRELSPGTYLVEGMKFSMPGWWEVKLEVRAQPGADKVTFNTVLDTAGVQR